MRITLVNRYFFPDQSATSRMVSSLAFALAGRGFPVRVVTSRSHYESGGAPLPSRENIRGVDVHRLRMSGFGRRNLVGRSADYATFHLLVGAWLLGKTRSGDVCVVCTDPPLLSSTAALPLKLRGALLVNWVMDLFPEVAMELGVMPKAGILARLTMALRDWSLGAAALTVCPIEAMTRYLASRIHDKADIVTVRHWANDHEIRPVEPGANRLRREWGLQDAFVVGYSGNFGRAHEFTTLLAAADRLRQEDVRFLMIGDGSQRAMVEDKARRLGLPNVIFKPYQPSSNLAESLSASDVHIVSLLPNLEHCVVPSKLYGILAAGRPTLFVGDPDGEIGSVLRSAGCGDAVAPGDADGLAARIRRLRDVPDHRRALGTRALALLQSEYSLAVGIERWCAAIRQLAPEPLVAPPAIVAPGAGS